MPKMKHNHLKNQIDGLMKTNSELIAEIERHKETTKSLMENKKLLESILSNAPIVVWGIDLNGIFTYSQYTGDKGNAPGDRVGKSALEVYKGTEVEVFIQKVLKDEIQEDIVQVGPIFYDTRVSPIHNEKGEKTGYLGVSMDITERIKTERELQKFRLVLDQVPGAIFILDKEWHFEYVNPYFTRMSGFTEEDLLHKTTNETVYNNSGEVPESRKEIVKNLNEGKSWQGELLTTNKNGTKYWANTIAAPFKNKNGEIDGYVVIQQDITEKKQLEQALHEKELLYRTLIEKSLDGISITQDNKFILSNNAFCNMLGFSMDELMQMEPGQLIAPIDRQRVIESHYKRLAGNSESNSFQANFLNKSGKEIVLDVKATTVQIDGKNASFVTIRDMTERLKFEKALSESELKYKTLVENSGDGIIITQNGKFKFANSAMCRMLGYTLEEFYTMDGVDIIPEHERERILKIHNDRMNGLIQSLNYSLQLVSKDGRIIDVDAQSSTVEFEGKPAAFMTLHNVTESKRMQKALLESEKKYRELTEMLPQTVYELDANGNVVYFNHTGYDQFGIEKSDIGSPAYLFISPEQRGQMMQNIQKTITERKTTFGNKYTAVCKNGETFPAMTFAAPIVSEDKVIGIRGLILDMSENEAMEKALRESEEKYRTLIDKATDGIVITQNGLIKFSNPAMCSMMQYAQEELLEQPYLNYVVPDDQKIMVDYHKRRMDGENFTSIYRSRFIPKDEKIITMELNARTSEYNGQPAAFIIIRNITERLKIEQELQLAKTELEKLNQDLEMRIISSSKRLTEANTQLIKLQKENLQSQFEVLRQQVNPHFLFNSLNVLTSLIKLEPDLAEQFTEHLSKVYRYVLENKDNDLVSLQTELDFLDAYIFLLHIRFLDKIEVKVAIPDAKKELLILPLALQLLIENAIKHNSMSKKNPLIIEISVDNKNVLQVENNLQERESHMVSTGVGLKNIEHRYHLLEMPAPQFLKTKTKFVARIPLKA
ncbi:hypothetical protein MASR2M47_25910 [Draconibacterium sp.]